MKKIKWIIAVLSIGMVSCEKEADVTLPATPGRLIVEGRVEKIIGEEEYEQQVVLSLLNDFFDPSQTPRVEDAEVEVYDGLGNRYPYTPDPDVPGRYVNRELKGEVGQAYTLSIRWDGQEYEATETMVSVPPLDDVYQQFEEENAFEDGGLKLAIDFTDPAGEPNYYFWELYMDGENQIQPDPGNSGNVVAKDEFWDGQTIEGYYPNEEKTFVEGDEVMVRHIGISKETYDFLFLLFEQTGQTGQLIDVPPALIKGNIRNLTQPDNIAMGYFGASEVDEETLVITAE